MYCMFCHNLNLLVSWKLHFPRSSHDIKCNSTDLVLITFWLWNVSEFYLYISLSATRRFKYIRQHWHSLNGLLYALLNVDNYVSPETRPWCENSVRIVSCEYTHYNSEVKIFLLKISSQSNCMLSCPTLFHLPSIRVQVMNCVICAFTMPCSSNVSCIVLYCATLHLVQWFVLYCTNIPLCWIPWQEALWRLDSGVYEGMYKLLCVTRHNIPSSLFRISVW